MREGMFIRYGIPTSINIARNPENQGLFLM